MTDHSSPVNATTEGYTEAEGYAASLRQLADWAETVPNDFDEDELRAAAAFIERQQTEIEALRIRAQCVPSVVEVASAIHDARFGPDYPENMRNSFDTECASGRAYCIRIARAMLDGFQLAHTSSFTSPGCRDELADAAMAQRWRDHGKKI